MIPYNYKLHLITISPRNTRQKISLDNLFLLLLININLLCNQKSLFRTITYLTSFIQPKGAFNSVGFFYHESVYDPHDK